MVTMVDEIFDRHYQEARAELNTAIAAGLGHLARTVRDAFEVLVNIEYQAPWAAKSTRRRCN
jgi:hypothetical protein